MPCPSHKLGLVDPVADRVLDDDVQHEHGEEKADALQDGCPYNDLGQFNLHCFEVHVSPFQFVGDLTMGESLTSSQCLAFAQAYADALTAPAALIAFGVGVMAVLAYQWMRQFADALFGASK